MARNEWVTFEECSLDTMNGVHDFGSDTFSVRLITDAATEPLAGTATPRWADFSANECTQGGGYTTGGEELTGTATSEAAGVTKFDSDENPVWTKTAGSPTDIYWAVLVNDSATNEECVGFLDMGGPVSMVSGDVTVTWNAAGILTNSVTA
jgi:hypothetical protein